jgi:hypothetical protein
MKIIFIGLDAGDVHLNLNDAGINAIHRCAQGLIEHVSRTAQFEPHVQPTMTNEDGPLTAHLVPTKHALLANRR